MRCGDSVMIQCGRFGAASGSARKGAGGRWPRRMQCGDEVFESLLRDRLGALWFWTGSPPRAWPRASGYHPHPHRDPHARKSNTRQKLRQPGLQYSRARTNDIGCVRVKDQRSVRSKENIRTKACTPQPHLPPVPETCHAACQIKGATVIKGFFKSAHYVRHVSTIAVERPHRALTSLSPTRPFPSDSLPTNLREGYYMASHQFQPRDRQIWTSCAG